MQVHVFKTSVESRHDIESVAPVLNTLVQKSGRWNFDLEDCDHVLRVESSLVDAQNIIRAVTTAGFMCSELPD